MLVVFTSSHLCLLRWLQKLNIIIVPKYPDYWKCDSLQSGCLGM